MNDPKAWRWWNGARWSVVALPNDGEQEVSRSANTLYLGPTSDIEWTDYYPDNARVARIDPATGKVTGGEA